MGFTFAVTVSFILITPFLSPSRGTRHPPSKRYLLSLTLSIVAQAEGSGRQGYTELRHGLRPYGLSAHRKSVFFSVTAREGVLEEELVMSIWSVIGLLP